VLSPSNSGFNLNRTGFHTRIIPQIDMISISSSAAYLAYRA
jgi:hypothetical protein